MRCVASDGNGFIDAKGDQMVAQKCYAAMSAKLAEGKDDSKADEYWKKFTSQELGLIDLQLTGLLSWSLIGLRRKTKTTFHQETGASQNQKSVSVMKTCEASNFPTATP